jgi:single-strand DNA-binding protein
VNNVTVAGNVTREPELRYTSGGQPFCKFGLAVNRRFTNSAGETVDEVDYFDVTAWRDLATNIAESVPVGCRVVVAGRLQQDRWENEGGEKRSKVQITAEEVSVSLRFAKVQVSKPSRSNNADEREPAMAGEPA